MGLKGKMGSKSGRSDVDAILQWPMLFRWMTTGYNLIGTLNAKIRCHTSRGL